MIDKFVKPLFWVGAGLSLASGVADPPDYSEAAYWTEQKRYRQDFARWREHSKSCLPNRGHQVLREIQLRLPLTRIVTLNQDGLLQRAGCEVLELHGSAWTDSSFPLRPGQDLDIQLVQRVFDWIDGCDGLVVVGSSSRMQPACEFPLRVRGRARLVEINPVETPLSAHCDDCWRGAAELLLERFLH